jgi:hypothetical protein
MENDERRRERRLKRRKLREEGGQVTPEAAGDEEMPAQSATADTETAEPSFTSSTEWDDLAPAQPVETQNVEPPVARLGAVAEILATPSMAELADDMPEHGMGTAGQPFFAKHTPAPPPDDIVEQEMRVPEEPFADHAPPHAVAHDHRQEQAWTREPILLALLLVALIVLALDTYLTLHLSGLSDRLAAATTAKPAAAVTSVAGGDRPWVGVDSIRTAAFANGGQPVTTVHIVNSGREPAYDLRSNTVGSLRSSATPAPAIPAQKGPLATTGMLLPNTGGNLTFFANTRALTPQEAGSVRSGQFVLWLAGRLDYKDSNGAVHATSFRYRYNPALNSFVAAPDGNSAN